MRRESNVGFVKQGQETDDPALHDPMFFGQYGWKLAEQRELAHPIACKGSLGLWNLPYDVNAALVAQLGEVAP